MFQAESFLKVFSSALGWIYTLSWAASFYPQVVRNWQRKSTQGFAIEFAALNVVGFICYTISTACFLFSGAIREQYAIRRPMSPEPTTRVNDLAFGLHAVVLTSITYSQFWPSLWGFSCRKKQHINTTVAGIIWGCVLSIVVVSGIVLLKQGLATQDPRGWALIDLAYTFSYLKLLVTLVKYVPQVITNHHLKSTVGWSISVTVFDVTGGVLSILQLIIDASFQGDWSGISGNPLKFGLAFITLCFDLVLILQHLILHQDISDMNQQKSAATRPLLDSD